MSAVELTTLLSRRTPLLLPTYIAAVDSRSQAYQETALRVDPHRSGRRR